MNDKQKQQVTEYRKKYDLLKKRLKSEKINLSDFWLNRILPETDLSYSQFSNIMRGLSTKPRPDIIEIVDDYLGV